MGLFICNPGHTEREPSAGLDGIALDDGKRDLCRQVGLLLSEQKLCLDDKGVVVQLAPRHRLDNVVQDRNAPCLFVRLQEAVCRQDPKFRVDRGD